jgi:hypothetical protein
MRDTYPSQDNWRKAQSMKEYFAALAKQGLLIRNERGWGEYALNLLRNRTGRSGPNVLLTPAWRWTPCGHQSGKTNGRLAAAFS